MCVGTKKNEIRFSGQRNYCTFFKNSNSLRFQFNSIQFNSISKQTKYSNRLTTNINQTHNPTIIPVSNNTTITSKNRKIAYLEEMHHTHKNKNEK